MAIDPLPLPVAPAAKRGRLNPRQELGGADFGKMSRYRECDPWSLSVRQGACGAVNFPPTGSNAIPRLLFLDGTFVDRTEPWNLFAIAANWKSGVRL
jgi:hypothetical protein